MIQLTCTNCQTVLSIDDGFAGGVCRCHACGTIQTVPKNSQAAGTGGAGPKALYKTRAGAAGVSGGGMPSGLERLADVVASSGLSSAARQRSAPSAVVPRPAGRNAAYIVIAVVAALLIGGAVTYLLTKGKSTPAGGGPTGRPSAGGDTAGPISGPSYLGLPVTGPSVVFILDRGSGTADTFERMKSATLKSLESLPADYRFQIIFWKVGDQLVSSPEKGLAQVNSAGKEAARAAMADVGAFGQSTAGPAIEKAVLESPAEMFIVSGKLMDPADADAIVGARKSSTAPIHTIAVAGGAADALKIVAQRTGGTFQQLTPRELGEFCE